MMLYTVTPYFNTTRNRFWGYEPGDRMQMSVLACVPGQMTVDAACPEQAASMTFYNLNQDDRRNGKFETSLSVGDLVVVCDATRIYVISFESMRKSEPFAFHKVPVQKCRHCGFCVLANMDIDRHSTYDSLEMALHFMMSHPHDIMNFDNPRYSDEKLS